MSNLRETMTRLASEFAADLLGAIRNASLEDISALGQTGAVAPKKHVEAAPARAKSDDSGNGRRRRTADDIEEVADSILAALRGKKDGVRAEALRQALGVERSELSRPLHMLLEKGSIHKQGEKRATTYFDGPARSTKRGAKPAPKRGGAGRKSGSDGSQSDSSGN